MRESSFATRTQNTAWFLPLPVCWGVMSSCPGSHVSPHCPVPLTCPAHLSPVPPHLSLILVHPLSPHIPCPDHLCPLRCPRTPLIPSRPPPVTDSRRVAVGAGGVASGVGGGTNALLAFSLAASPARLGGGVADWAAPSSTLAGVVRAGAGRSERALGAERSGLRAGEGRASEPQVRAWPPPQGLFPPPEPQRCPADLGYATAPRSCPGAALPSGRLPPAALGARGMRFELAAAPREGSVPVFPPVGCGGAREAGMGAWEGGLRPCRECWEQVGEQRCGPGPGARAAPGWAAPGALRERLFLGCFKLGCGIRGAMALK